MSDKGETTPPVTSAGAEEANERGRRAIKGLPPAGVDFASDEAAEAWVELGRPELPRKGSGKDGAITKADVKAAAAAKEE